MLKLASPLMPNLKPVLPPRWACTFHFLVLISFVLGSVFFASATQTLPNAKAVLSGKWALIYFVFQFLYYLNTDITATI